MKASRRIQADMVVNVRSNLRGYPSADGDEDDSHGRSNFLWQFNAKKLMCGPDQDSGNRAAETTTDDNAAIRRSFPRHLSTRCACRALSGFRFTHQEWADPSNHRRTYRCRQRGSPARHGQQPGNICK